MSDKHFIDSNVILYAFMKEPLKQEISRKIMELSNGIISNQVIAEISSNLIKKASYSNQEISILTEVMYDTYVVMPIGRAEFSKSVGIREKFSFSFWDSLIIASALENGCDLIYSEDMQNGMKIENLTIVNPFILI